MPQEDLDKAFLTISKEKLCNLPPAGYKGQIIVIDKPEEVENAIKNLRSEKVIGFDTETRPSFRRGQTYNVALIQLAIPGYCYLFRTNDIGYPKQLINLLEDGNIIKVGLSVHDDFHNLRRVTEVDPQGFIDLQSFVKNFKIADNSLSRIFGILFGERISKGQRLTNWESQELSDSQLNYAALDAEACLRIYNYLKGGEFNPYQSEYLTFPQEPEDIKEENKEQ